MPDQKSWLCKLHRDASCRWDNYDTRADVVSGRYLVPSHLTLTVKYQVKGYRMVSEARYRLSPFWNGCWRNLRTITGMSSFDLEFYLEGQMWGQRSRFCKLPKEGSYRMRLFSYACRRNFRIISYTLSFDLKFDLEDHIPKIIFVSTGRGAWLSFETMVRADVIFDDIRYPVLDLTLERGSEEI